MVFGALAILALGYVTVNYLKTRNAAPVITPSSSSTELRQTEGQVASGLPASIKVEAGQDLWKIAEKYYQSGYNWVDIAEANTITNPDMLYVDVELTLPQVAVRQITVDKTPEVAVAATESVGTSGTIETEAYTASPGDHLWSIAVRAYGDGYQWVKIAEANAIANPDYIEVGQVLKLPR